MVTKSKSRAGETKAATGGHTHERGEGATSQRQQCFSVESRCSAHAVRFHAEMPHAGRASAMPAGSDKCILTITLLTSDRNHCCRRDRGVGPRRHVGGIASQFRGVRRQGSVAGVPDVAGSIREWSAGSRVTELRRPGAVSFDPFNLGTGLALAHRLEKKRNVVIALSTEEDSVPEGWHEAMKFAGIHKLPIVYVKSGFAFETAPAKGTPMLEELSFMARDCGFPAIVVDGKDAVAVWRVAHESIHRARNGAGPTLIECVTRVVLSLAIRLSTWSTT